MYSVGRLHDLYGILVHLRFCIQHIIRNVVFQFKLKDYGGVNSVVIRVVRKHIQAAAQVETR